MSIWGEVAGQTSAVVLGVGGLVGTYYAGRSTARESRHQARLEAVYAELAHMTDDHSRGLEEVARGETALNAFLESEEEPGRSKALSLVSIYASNDVIDGFLATVAERKVLHELLEQHIEDPDSAEAVEDKAVQEALDRLRRARYLLTDAMREDLAVARLRGRNRRMLRRYRAAARRTLKL